VDNLFLLSGGGRERNCGGELLLRKQLALKNEISADDRLRPQSTSRQVMPASVPRNRSPWAPTGVGPFPCNQLAMRSKNDAGRHERCHLAQYGPSEPLAEDGQAPTLPIVQLQSASAQLRS
jgi:hypothetical protein